MSLSIGFIGLGRMGGPMASRLASMGYEIYGYDKEKKKNPPFRQFIQASGYGNLAELVHKSETSLFWIQTPHDACDVVLQELNPCLRSGDIIVNGANSNWEDEKRRALSLAVRGIDYLDAGTSGGLEGAFNGVNFTIGGREEAFRKVRGVFNILSQGRGVYYVQLKKGTGIVPSYGLGALIKSVHNAIEYGAMQAYAEGLDLLARISGLDRSQLSEIAGNWNKGALIRSELLGYFEKALNNKELEDIVPKVGSAGPWARDILTLARQKGVDMPALEAALDVRDDHRGSEFTRQLLAATRKEFGGHAYTVKPVRG
ncbi:hypothetical protein HYT58_02165 [Candidatus Woesearchaeota archaeon]|nr:hypothetical protein [Candidatus Woesearchaeota archaeon]